MGARRKIKLKIGIILHRGKVHPTKKGAEKRAAKLKKEGKTTRIVKRTGGYIIQVKR